MEHTLTPIRAAVEYEFEPGPDNEYGSSTAETLSFRVEPPLALADYSLETIRLTRRQYDKESGPSWDKTLKGMPLTAKGTVRKRATWRYIYIEGEDDLAKVMALVGPSGLRGIAGENRIQFTREEVEQALASGEILRRRRLASSVTTEAEVTP